MLLIGFAGIGRAAERVFDPTARTIMGKTEPEAGRMMPVGV